MCSVDGQWEEGDLKQNCNGRIVSTGSFTCTPYFTIALQVLGIALFFAFPGVYFYIEHNQAAPIVIGAILSFFLLYCFINAAFRDPGVIPRARQPLYAIHDLRPPRSQNINTTNGKEILKYCEQCYIFRSPRVEHCSSCNNCIMKFDHHCPWVGNCIGQRNYRYFYGFLVFLCLFIILSFSCSLAEIIIKGMNSSSFDAASGGALALLLYSICCGSFSFGLCGMHTYLVIVDKTTYDLTRKRSSTIRLHHPDREFSCVDLYKCRETLFGPLPTSLVRETYKERFIIRGDEVDVEQYQKPLRVMEVSPSEYSLKLNGSINNNKSPESSLERLNNQKRQEEEEIIVGPNSVENTTSSQEEVVMQNDIQEEQQIRLNINQLENTILLGEKEDGFAFEGEGDDLGPRQVEDNLFQQDKEKYIVTNNQEDKTASLQKEDEVTFDREGDSCLSKQEHNESRKDELKSSISTSLDTEENENRLAMT